MTYIPQPIDTDDITLDQSHETLIDALTENVHDVWAAKRIADGWTFGPVRDDEKMQHPCLVPFTDLSESEKSYDKAMIEQAIKAALSLGYAITPP